MLCKIWYLCKKVIFTALYYHYIKILNRINLLISYFDKKGNAIFSDIAEKQREVTFVSFCHVPTAHWRNFLDSPRQIKITSRWRECERKNLQFRQERRPRFREMSFAEKSYFDITKCTIHIYADRKHNTRKKWFLSRKIKSKMLNKIFSYQASFSRELILKFRQFIMYIQLENDDLISYYRIYFHDDYNIIY